MGDDEDMTALAHEDNQAIHKVLVCRNADNAFAGHFRW